MTYVFDIIIFRTWRSLSWKWRVYNLVVSFLMLHRQFGTLSLMISGHPTPSQPSYHHFKLTFFSSPTDCVWGGGREGERGRGKGERERENRWSIAKSERFFFLTYCCFMKWTLCSEGEMAQKRTNYYYCYILRYLIHGQSTLISCVDDREAKLFFSWLFCFPWYNGALFRVPKMCR